MTVRRTARWQTSLDDRILEYLRDEPWATPGEMVQFDAIDATRVQVRERCRVLADAELVAFHQEGSEIVELTTWGKQYLRGNADVELHQTPRSPRQLEKARTPP